MGFRAQQWAGGSFCLVFLGLFLGIFSVFSSDWLQVLSQPVIRSVDPRARQSVNQSSTRARRSASQSGGRSVGPCAKHQAVSQSDSRSVGPPVLETYDDIAK